MSDVNARFRIVDSGAYAAPGTCYVCGRAGNSDERGMIDTGNTRQWEGAVYLCSYCVLEMAEEYGAASPATMLHRMAAEESSMQEYAAARERLEKAEGILNAVGAGHLLDPDNLVVISGVVPAFEEAPVSESEPTEVTGQGTADESKVDEPVNESRSDDFSGSASTDDGFDWLS